MAQAADDQGAPKDQNTLNRHLGLAAYGGDAKEVVRLLGQGANPNCSIGGTTPLRAAALVYRGPDLKAEYRHEKFEECVRALVNAGASIETLKTLENEEGEWQIKTKHPALASLIERMKKEVPAAKDEKKKN